MIKKYVKYDDVLNLIVSCSMKLKLSSPGNDGEFVSERTLRTYLKTLPTIDVEEANEKKLTKPEAIFYLKRCKDWFPPFTPEVEKWNEALDEAIEALNRVEELEKESKDGGWIPVNEPPKENGDYIVSLEDSVYPWGRFFNGKWFMLSTDGIAREFAEYEVLAWKPLPEPYERSEEE